MAAAERDPDQTLAAQSGAARWFSRLWAVAILAHVIGNPRVGQLWPNTTALGVSTLVLGLVAAALVVVPGERRLLVASGLGVPVVAWFEAPFIGNHWVVASFVGVALLVSQWQTDSWGWFARTGRWILLGFYTWAAFNKLNAGFFDPDVSCGAVYANQWLDAAGLPTFALGGTTAWLIAAATTATELAVPLLLLLPRTRRWGVLLGFVFHGFISLDLGQHFYDFTALLLALFTLFLPDEITESIERRLAASPLRQGLMAAVPLVLVYMSVAPPNTAGLWLIQKGVFFVWVPTLLAVVAVTALSVRGRADVDVSLRLREPIGIALVALVVFNGFTPYLELKTGYGWNMYANLVTADGESNHFVIRRTIPLTDENRDPVEIIDTDDPGLAAYVGSGWQLPARNLRDYLADRPDVSVTYRQRGETHTATGAELGEKLPVLMRKFQLFRAVDSERPPRCQQVWLPAY